MKPGPIEVGGLPPPPPPPYEQFLAEQAKPTFTLKSPTDVSKPEPAAGKPASERLRPKGAPTPGSRFDKELAAKIADRRAKMPECIELISDGSRFSPEEKAAWTKTPQRPGPRVGGLIDPDVARTVREGILARGRLLRGPSVDSPTSSSSEDSMGMPTKPAAAVAPARVPSMARSPGPVGLMITVAVARRPEPPLMLLKPVDLRVQSSVSRLPGNLESGNLDTPTESLPQSIKLKIDSITPHVHRESESLLAPAGRPGTPRVSSAGITPRVSTLTPEAPAAASGIAWHARPVPSTPAREAPAPARVQPRQPVAAKPAQGTHAAPWIRTHVLDRLDHLMHRLPAVSAPKLHAPSSPLRYVRGF